MYTELFFSFSGHMARSSQSTITNADAEARRQVYRSVRAEQRGDGGQAVERCRKREFLRLGLFLLL